MKKILALIALLFVLGVFAPSPALAGHGYYGHCHGGGVVFSVGYGGGYYQPHCGYYHSYPRYAYYPRCYSYPVYRTRCYPRYYAPRYYSYGYGYRRCR